MRVKAYAFGALELGELACAVDFDACAEDLDLVGVHGGVGDQDLRVLDAFGAAYTDRLVKDEACTTCKPTSMKPSTKTR